MTADVSMSQQIKEVLATYLKRDPNTLLPEHNLRDDVGLDSLMTFELLYDLEKTFDLEIPNEDLPGLRTIADVVKYLEGRISLEELQKVRSSLSTPQTPSPPLSPVNVPKPPNPEKVRAQEKSKKPSTPKATVTLTTSKRPARTAPKPAGRTQSTKTSSTKGAAKRTPKKT